MQSPPVDFESVKEKMNGIISTPPPLQYESNQAIDMGTTYGPSFVENPYNGQQSPNPQSTPGVKEEVIFVPTPVNQDYYDKLKQMSNKEEITHPRFLQSLNLDKSAIIDQSHLDLLRQQMENNSTHSKAFEDIVNSHTNDQNKIEKYIELQEKDYDQYFQALNHMEYNKVYNSLNQRDMDKLYSGMIQAENQIDYSKFYNPANTAFNSSNIKSGNSIDLPMSNSQEMSLFSGLYNRR